MIIVKLSTSDIIEIIIATAYLKHNDTVRLYSRTAAWLNRNPSGFAVFHQSYFCDKKYQFTADS